MSNSLIDTLIRDAIGYDNLTRFGLEPALKYPPHNITSVGDDSYTLTMAVAGFSKDDLQVTIENNQLTIIGSIANKPNPEGFKILYQGLAFREFVRSWKLGEYMEVYSVALQDGLLTVKLHRNIPELKKARKITID
jgi:molecular chaperone IbpA